MPDAASGHRPRLLDLFCGAGGCSVGYERAGFEGVGWMGRYEAREAIPPVYTEHIGGQLLRWQSSTTAGPVASIGLGS